MEDNKRNKCGYCTSYDLWCGICLHPLSPRFINDEEAIYERRPCKLFTLSDEYKQNTSI